MADHVSRYQWCSNTMKFLRRWLSLRYRLRSRHWQARALKAEARVRQLEADLQAEGYRNREREDMFVSATVMGSRGMYGVRARTGPAIKRVDQPSAPQLYSSDPFDRLSWAEKEEFKMFYLQDGLNSGFSEQQIRQRFMEELASRKILNDEITAQ